MTSARIVPFSQNLSQFIPRFLQERDKAQEEVGTLKKDNDSLSSKVTKLTSDLSTLTTTHSKLKEESLQVEGHRDMLLDKVERLHADKHKLEDRWACITNYTVSIADIFVLFYFCYGEPENEQ